MVQDLLENCKEKKAGIFEIQRGVNKMFCPNCGTEIKNKDIIWEHTEKIGIYEAKVISCPNKNCTTSLKLEDRGSFHTGDYRGERIIEIVYR